METHKRVLGILYIVSGAMHILIMLFLSALLSLLLPFIFENAKHLRKNMTPAETVLWMHLKQVKAMTGIPQTRMPFDMTIK